MFIRLCPGAFRSESGYRPLHASPDHPLIYRTGHSFVLILGRGKSRDLRQSNRCNGVGCIGSAQPGGSSRDAGHHRLR